MEFLQKEEAWEMMFGKSVTLNLLSDYFSSGLAKTLTSHAVPQKEDQEEEEFG